MKQTLYVLALIIVILLIQPGRAAMRLKNLGKLPACSDAEEGKIKELFGLLRRKGGAGGSALKWSEELKAVIIFPGEDGKPDGSGGRGASPEFNLSNSAVFKVNATEGGLVISFPGLQGFLPWEFVEDLQKLKKLDSESAK